MKQKRALLDALAERAQFAAPESLVEAEFAEIWRQVEQEKAAGRADPEDEAKDEATLKAEYHAIADRRVRLGLLVAEIGRANDGSVTDQEFAAGDVRRSDAVTRPGDAGCGVLQKEPAGFGPFPGIRVSRIRLSITSSARCNWKKSRSRRKNSPLIRKAK